MKKLNVSERELYLFVKGTKEVGYDEQWEKGYNDYYFIFNRIYRIVRQANDLYNEWYGYEFNDNERFKVALKLTLEVIG